MNKGVILVTGGAIRIGKAIVEHLARHGFDVAIHYNESRDDAERLRDTVIEKMKQDASPLKSLPKIEIFQANLARESDVLGLIPRVSKTMGDVTGLINNASLFVRDEVLTATKATWDAHMMINLRAPFLLMQEFAARLPENVQGAIINMVDQRVVNLTPHFTSYTLSKSGLWTLTQTMALALAPRIRVNAIGPGPVVATPGQSPSHFSRMVAATPLEIVTPPQDIAETVLYLLNASTVTGQLMLLDGGQHLSWKNT